MSSGTRIIRNPAAAREAKAVWSGLGSLDRNGFELRRARIPALAAVSPNRAGAAGGRQRVGKRGVGKAEGRTDRALEQSGSQTIIETTKTTLGVEGLV